MSSTDEKRRELLRQFFAEHLCGRLPGGRARLVDSAEAAETFYKDCGGRRIERSCFELDFGDADEIAATLDAQWAGTAFAGLGARLVALRSHFEDVPQQRSVSDFVYEMF